MPTTTKQTVAEKFRDMAARLGREVEAKRGPRNENTPKRQREGMSARIEAAHLERVQRALEALADGRDNLSIPPILAGITSKAQLLDMLRTEINCPSYYQIVDTGKFRDQSEAAQTLRAFVESARTGANRIGDEQREAKERIIALENKVKFLPIPGFFPTPPEVVEALIDSADLFDGCKVLEPSAGKGDIADALTGRGYSVVCCEVSPTLCDILSAKGHHVINGDFLERFSVTDPVEGAGEVTHEMRKWDRIIMNPPFENGQDIDHVRHAYKLLKPGGRLVSVMSSGPFFRQDRKATEFRAWLDSVPGTHEELDPDAFKNAFRATGTKTHLVMIGKLQEVEGRRPYDLFA